MKNTEVTKFLDEFNHPLRVEIELLRELILSSHNELKENIKWNAPNYTHNENDRITMKLMPPKQVQIILHRGSKKREQPKNRLIIDESNLLSWKENDRAIASFKNLAEINDSKDSLVKIIQQWIKATE
jgi:uncharacterized protein YdeI (YjbR/CyaY-like superfamily)